MKRLLLIVTVAALGIAFWQRQRVADLRAQEARILAQRSNPVAPESANNHSRDAAETEAPLVSEAELSKFTTGIVLLKADFEGSRLSGRPGEEELHPDLCETLARLTSAQLRTLLEAWPRGDSPEGRRGMQNLMQLAARVNPSAAVPLIYEMNQGKNSSPLHSAAMHWFRQDADGLLRWALEIGIPDDFLWTNAARALLDPSVENMGKILTSSEPDRSGLRNTAVSGLAAKLGSQDLRLKFLQSLHATTSGSYDNLGKVAQALADRISFAQFASLADQTPAFKPSDLGRKDSIGRNEPLGSLRYEVALRSRDAAASERWAWLTQREEDRPQGKFLATLARAWCANDYGDAAAWVRSLPAGAEREAVVKEVVGFLESGGSRKLAAEWK